MLRCIWTLRKIASNINSLWQMEIISAVYIVFKKSFSIEEMLHLWFGDTSFFSWHFRAPIANNFEMVRRTSMIHRPMWSKATIMTSFCCYSYSLCKLRHSEGNCQLTMVGVIKTFSHTPNVTILMNNLTALRSNVRCIFANLYFDNWNVFYQLKARRLARNMRTLSQDRRMTALRHR